MTAPAGKAPAMTDWIWSGPGACECSDTKVSRLAKGARATSATSFECEHGLWVGGPCVTPKAQP